MHDLGTRSVELKSSVYDPHLIAPLLELYQGALSQATRLSRASIAVPTCEGVSSTVTPAASSARRFD